LCDRARICAANSKEKRLIKGSLIEENTMDLEERLWTIEELFWKGDSDFYRDHLTADCLMLFPEPVGILTNEQIVGSIANAPRWSRVTIEDRRILKFSDGALILTYRVKAQREGDPSTYSALVSSGYVNRDGLWKLAFHQQTPQDSQMTT
jgi:Domain of unknown function (DUF4440)